MGWQTPLNLWNTVPKIPSKDDLPFIRQWTMFQSKKLFEYCSVCANPEAYSEHQICKTEPFITIVNGYQGVIYFCEKLHLRCLTTLKFFEVCCYWPIKMYWNKVIDVILVTLLLTLNTFHTLFWCFHCWHWTRTCSLCLYLQILQNVFSIYVPKIEI